MAPTQTAQASYRGEGMPLFKLAFGTGLLTLITLGIYRFWAKTRIRQYIWSSARLEGDAFEYTGTGLEKFLGFLVSVVVLAVYLAVVQLILFAFGLRFIVNPRTEAEMIAQVLVIYSTFFALLPLMFFASYRARRYRLARTRFRGIRFGMESAAGGYTWRAVLLLLATICTFGLLAPLMRFRLEKYMSDRTFYGDTRLVQGGKWTGLYGSMKHVFIGIGLLVLAGVFAATEIAALALLAGAVGYVWLLVGVVAYQVQGMAYLTNHKILGRDVTFLMAPSTGTVIWRYVIGGIQIALIVAAVSAVVGGIGMGMLQSAGSFTPGQTPPFGIVVVLAAAYLATLVFIGALSLALITQPILAHLITQTEVQNVAALSIIRQRVTDKGADAEGFADALDIGGAF